MTESGEPRYGFLIGVSFVAGVISAIACFANELNIVVSLAVAAVTTFVYPTIGVLVSRPTLAFYEAAVGRPYELDELHTVQEHPAQERLRVAATWPVFVPMLLVYAAVHGFIRRLL